MLQRWRLTCVQLSRLRCLTVSPSHRPAVPAHSHIKHGYARTSNTDMNFLGDMRKQRWQGISRLWSADFGVGVEYVDVVYYFCFLDKGGLLQLWYWRVRHDVDFVLIFFRFFVDFIFVDFDKILNKSIYLFDIFLGNYFQPTLPSQNSLPTLGPLHNHDLP